MNENPSPLIRQTNSSGIRHLEMSSARLNALSQPLRIALLQALDDAEHDTNVRAVVLSGAGGTFSAGADLNEFDSGRGLAEPTLHGTINSFLDRMRTPVISAIAGRAFGGGLELALATHYRVATTSVQLALPETRFGFLPGAGGTQRLPRLIGVDLALKAITRAQVLGRDDLIETELIDRWVEDDDDLLTVATQFARALKSGESPKRVRDLPLGNDSTEAFLMIANHDVHKRSKRIELDRAVIRAIESGRKLFDDGVAEEGRLFREFAVAPEAAAARYLFLAERRVRRIDGVPSVSAPGAVGVVGAGMMGRGIALSALLAGMRVLITDSAPESRTRAVEAIRMEAARGRLAPSETERLLSNLSVVDKIEDFGCVDIVIEAVIEDALVKADVFARIARALPSAVIASNTSGLDLDVLAMDLPDPSRLIGMHFFAPAQTMPVVELVRTRESSQETEATALAVATALKKVAIPAAVGPGFIGNRIFDRYIEASLSLITDGAEASVVDAALEAWGMRLGPFATLDLIGNDVFWKGRLPEQLLPDSVWNIVGELVEAGRFGRKSGQGWFDYTKPRVPITVSDEQVQAIVEAIIAPMVDEGVRVLEDGIARDPSDIDILFVKGYGFPAERGGPMWFADSFGLTNVVRVLSRPGNKREPHQTLVRLSNEDRRVSNWNEAR